MEGRVRRQDPRPDAPPRRGRRLVARAVHDGRGPVPRRPDDLQAALRRRPHLPRRTDHQLVPARPDGALRHRGRPPRRRRRAREHPLRRAPRQGGPGHHRRDDPRRDDARRHGRRGPPRRRAVRPPRRHRDRAAADRPPDPDRRRRARRPGVRHRRRQGHARARPERLRDRPAARPGQPDRARRARHRHGAGPLRGDGPLRGAPRRRRRPARGGADRRREAPVRPRGRSLRPLRHRDRAAALGAVVRQGRDARRRRRGRRPRRQRRHPPRVDGPALLRLGRQHARLVHLASALVGSPHPGLVRPPGRDGLCRPGRRRAGARRRRHAAAGVAPGRGRPRHLVLQRPLAVLDPRLARGDPRPAPLLPDRRAAHGLRHHLLLGRPDDDVRPLRDGRAGALQDDRAHRPGARRPRAQDEQVQGQRRRPARLDGRLRLRRAALHARAGRQPRCRRPGQRGVGAGQPQLLHQALERHPVRAPERRDRRG